MNYKDLTPEQAKEVAERLRPTRDYLLKVVVRMEQREFPAGDEVYQAAKHSLSHLEDLCELLGRIQHGYPLHGPKHKMGSYRNGAL